MSSRTISTAAEELFPRNKLRKSFAVQNEDVSVVVYLKKERAVTPTVSATDHDHGLRPTATIALNFETDGEEAIQDRWTVVAASGTPRISFIETETIHRSD